MLSIWHSPKSDMELKIDNNIYIIDQIILTIIFHYFISSFRFKGSVLVLTFIAYTCYHMNRKPISVFKNVINRNCSDLQPPPGQDIDPNDDTWCDWAPFGMFVLAHSLTSQCELESSFNILSFGFSFCSTDQKGSDALLGVLDSSFLFAYAIAMFAR